MIEELKEIIKNGRKIVFFGGAGVSTESGIPDFRSENGIYKTKSEYGMSPEEIISRSFFDRKPEIFYNYYTKNLIYLSAEPNDAHKALAKLEEQGKLTAIVTQNIDGLHQKAGSKNVFELHGSVIRNYCMKCNMYYDVSYIMEPGNCENHIPRCKNCRGMVKPDVVLYEEPLDSGVMSKAVAAIADAEILIVGGTSLVVYPAAGFINYFRGNKLILINKSETAFDGKADLVIHDSIGKVLGSVTSC